MDANTTTQNKTKKKQSNTGCPCKGAIMTNDTLHSKRFAGNFHEHVNHNESQIWMSYSTLLHHNDPPLTCFRFRFRFVSYTMLFYTMATEDSRNVHENDRSWIDKWTGYLTSFFEYSQLIWLKGFNSNWTIELILLLKTA